MLIQNQPRLIRWSYIHLPRTKEQSRRTWYEAHATVIPRRSMIQVFMQLPCPRPHLLGGGVHGGSGGPQAAAPNFTMDRGTDVHELVAEPGRIGFVLRVTKLGVD